MWQSPPRTTTARAHGVALTLCQPSRILIRDRLNFVIFGHKCHFVSYSELTAA